MLYFTMLVRTTRYFSSVFRKKELVRVLCSVDAHFLSLNMVLTSYSLLTV
jgi:hypothetical protein